MAYQGDLVGEHESIVETRRLITRVAQSKTNTVVIYGETGTGKGLVARLLHEQSARSQNEFINVNCAAIPANLMESELFGYEKGAFTGAIGKKTGLVEAANGGSIFFDEIRELEAVQQAKLLSLLDTQEFRRVGAVKSIKVDVRFIAATNKILSGEVRAGKFRDDLYYRLQVVAINLSPLRDRGEDVLLLCEYFMRKFNTRYDRKIRDIEPAVADIFLSYHWPGNVRELENLLERIFILEPEDQVMARHIPPRIMREVEEGNGPIYPEDMTENFPRGKMIAAANLGFYEATLAFQKQLVEKALSASNGNITGASKKLGISRHALRHQINKLDIAT
ncbi:MAG: sigma-54-dependent Fis family transcriptional regulator [Rhodospirillales bacterium]|nr:sigma-54-dependent Fis family transcriptional regulator [Rhodospirillales bacterium]